MVVGGGARVVIYRLRGWAARYTSLVRKAAIMDTSRRNDMTLLAPEPQPGTLIYQALTMDERVIARSQVVSQLPYGALFVSMLRCLLEVVSANKLTASSSLRRPRWSKGCSKVYS